MNARESPTGWDGRLSVPRSPLSARTLQTETVLVLMVSLGASAVWSVISMVQTYLAARRANRSLSATTTTMNRSMDNASLMDLFLQLISISLALVPVLLALHLLAREIQSPARYLGFDASRPLHDLGMGLALAAAIGIPGLGLYLAARGLGLNTTLEPAALGDQWWAVPVLILAAIKNAVLEEVLMVGYLFTRWTQAGWKIITIIVVSALIRATYHLYQGFGGFVGNFVMGLILGAVYVRTRRVMPLVVMHATVDIVAFVGYSLLHEELSWL